MRGNHLAPVYHHVHTARSGAPRSDRRFSRLFSSGRVHRGSEPQCLRVQLCLRFPAEWCLLRLLVQPFHRELHSLSQTGLAALYNCPARDIFCGGAVTPIQGKDSPQSLLSAACPGSPSFWRHHNPPGRVRRSSGAHSGTRGQGSSGSRILIFPFHRNGIPAVPVEFRGTPLRRNSVPTSTRNGIPGRKFRRNTPELPSGSPQTVILITYVPIRQCNLYFDY